MIPWPSLLPCRSSPLNARLLPRSQTSMSITLARAWPWLVFVVLAVRTTLILADGKLSHFSLLFLFRDPDDCLRCICHNEMTRTASFSSFVIINYICHKLSTGSWDDIKFSQMVREIIMNKFDNDNLFIYFKRLKVVSVVTMHTWTWSISHKYLHAITSKLNYLLYNIDQ